MTEPELILLKAIKELVRTRAIPVGNLYEAIPKADWDAIKILSEKLFEL